MNFGRQEYQHRFFQEAPPHKKMALNIPSSSIVLPPISYERTASPPAYQQQIITFQPKLQPTYNQNYQQVYQGYEQSRIKTEQPSVQISQYQANAAVLDQFKRNAEEYRHRGKFDHLRRPNPPPIHYNTKTEGSEYYTSHPHHLQVEPDNETYNNPQIITTPDSKLLSHLANIENERALILSRLEQKNLDTNERLKSYRKKYSRLKRNLNNQLIEKRKEERLQSIVKEQLAASKEKDQLEEIKSMMSNISDHLRKNSRVLTESMKFRDQLSSQKNQFLEDPQFKNSFNQQRNSIDYSQNIQAQQISEYQSPPQSPPSVVYTKKSLDSQYNRMEKTKKDIKQLNFRLRKIKD